MEFLGGALIGTVSYISNWRGIMLSLNRPGIAPVLVLTALFCFILLCSPLKKRIAAAVGGTGLVLAVVLVSVFSGLAYSDDLTYYRTEGVHCVPKVKLDDLIL